MFIHRLAAQLATAPEYQVIEGLLDQGYDASLGLAQSARPLIIASAFIRNPRPTIVVVSGEEAADRMAVALSGYLGRSHVARYSQRLDMPWSDKLPDGAVIGHRTQTLSLLAAGAPVVAVASARSLARKVPPVETAYYKSLNFSVGDETDFSDIPAKLLYRGYSHTGAADTPGTFFVHGDSIDIFAAQSKNPVRIEFFGDEVDRIRTMVAATGQTIGDSEFIEVFPCREIALSPEAVKRASRYMYALGQNDDKVKADLELLTQGVVFQGIDRYLPLLYGSTVSPLEHISSKSLVVLTEPRSLFDDTRRYYDDVSSAAKEKGIDLQGLVSDPNGLDFTKNQRLTLVSIMRAGGTVDAELPVKHPEVSGNDEKFFARVKQLNDSHMVNVVAVPDRRTRERLSDDLDARVISRAEKIDSISWDPEAEARPGAGTLRSGIVTLTDISVPAGTIIPSANMGLISVSDLQRRSARAVPGQTLDITDITFPFKPGDYVVHAHHGIAFFNDIVKQEIDGKKRDYFLLEYASGDKLFVPLEQVGKLTRYVGPDGKNPRLTRLNTADWSRATAKAGKAAKKLAFDLVDLYTRRASVIGYSYSPDNSLVEEMESSFPYKCTPDQISSLADIKSDMESDKPMDRLLCGDVGFGKTEVALRAAFKAVQDGKQVMFLCPTTILAQQHFKTLFDRFSPFDVNVAVMSRFSTQKQQRIALEQFSEGELDVLIGTHRLLSADVNPSNLGLIIIDEEQRFGVQHKEQLKNMREQVDVLTLSATPIPRTMQMAMSGVRDMSLILTPPPNRRPVKVQVGEWDSDVVSSALRLEMERGGQAYYVSNRVRTIDDAVERVHDAVPEARVGVAHGKMNERQMESVMEDFINGDIDILVATTIVESGIDNPHTNTLIIEDSQRMGLAQLYQLKGRVGRSRTQAFAYFMFPAEEVLTPEATERLEAIDEFQELGSGMKISMRDLEIRGAGSLMGAEQSGNLSSVGFDLFTQMLGEAVAAARGESSSEVEASTVTLNLPVEYFLSEEYIPDADVRVLYYRKLAAATSLASINKTEIECENIYGSLPDAGRNLFDRARIRIRAQRLGVTSVALINGRITITNIQLSASMARSMKNAGGIYYATSHKLTFRYNSEDDLMVDALELVGSLGGDDEE